MQEIVNKDQIRERMLQVLRQSPRGLLYYANQIGIARITLHRLVSYNTCDLKTYLKVQNFVDSVLGPVEEKPQI